LFERALAPEPAERGLSQSGGHAQAGGIAPEASRQKLEVKFGKGLMRCPNCGSTKMVLIRIWSKAAGMIFELRGDGASECATGDSRKNDAVVPMPPQLAFGF
jgi:hypothetical protein